MKKNNQNIKKSSTTIALISIMVALAVLIVVVVVSLLPKAVPVPENTVTVTIDEPGVVLSLSPTDFSVQNAETAAPEDKHYSYNLAGSLPFKQSSSMLIKSLIEANVMRGVANESILLAVETDSVKDFETICSYFKDAMSESNCTAKLYTLHINEKLTNISELAEKHNTTYAKAMLCNKLSKELDIKVDELITKTVSEILNISKNSTGDDKVVEDIIDDVNSDAAEDDKQNVSSEQSSTSSETSSNVSSNDSSSNGSSSNDVSSNGSSSNDTSSNESSSASPSSGISFTQDPDDNDGWYPHM